MGGTGGAGTVEEVDGRGRRFFAEFADEKGNGKQAEGTEQEGKVDLVGVDDSEDDGG